MEMQFVDSSTIERIGYDPNSSTLRIEFKSNRTYDYFNVPENVFNELRSASSVGSYHARNIKNSYSYTEI
ncbi:KTSC domain-containing protein [Polaromonas sp. JS666]|uniref:KTSC domain-containing protein n=1 Tax=Polaromonas sp. (strain JS666 / ATCC BAA-500) TaxID=296591 RepID=UPI000887BCA1|nr:KTSC domain-containing protein [Polaromonas sp. JS666]